MQCKRTVCQSENANCMHVQTGEMYCESCARLINNQPGQDCLVLRRNSQFIVTCFEPYRFAFKEECVVRTLGQAFLIIQHVAPYLTRKEISSESSKSHFLMEQDGTTIFTIRKIVSYEVP